ncbi:two-component system response regulator [Vibrio sp. 10N.286.49.B3]|uniref:sigma-54-dependent transcriptional regulator n=1 Tax=Vibrio sp. 10N.286.49.B3 TaxID=1880855 RepID=UPI000C824614|nr:response regulator [Vibrio sp. 10N.286.49.B3]PMH43110.1 two-component system response regulator [Vibrio sp. 10N.286.49.B3]
MSEVYFIDDEPAIRDAIQQALLMENIDVTTFPNAVEALQCINTKVASVIITDIHMPVMNGLDFMNKLLADNPHFQVIVLSGYGDIKIAVNAIKSGAYDFLEKPISIEKLITSIRKAQEKLRLVQENYWLRKELEVQTQVGPKLIGHSPVMNELRRNIISLPLTSHILFTGETGTGKRIAAQYTHDIHSINCAELIPRSAYVLNRYSDSKFIKELNLLLSQTQQGSVYIHSAEALTKNQWQIINTCKSTQGRFILSAQKFPDATINTFVHFHLPTLKQRTEDIRLLFKHFVRGAASRYQLQPPKITNIDIEQLESYEWQGNIKQLRHYAEHFALQPERDALGQLVPMLDQDPLSFHQKMDSFEYTLLLDALQRHSGALKEIQIECNISRKTLYDKLKKHQLDKKEFK